TDKSCVLPLLRKSGRWQNDSYHAITPRCRTELCSTSQAPDRGGPSLQLTHDTEAGHILVGLDGGPTAFGHRLIPLEQQAWGDARQASNPRSPSCPAASSPRPTAPSVFGTIPPPSLVAIEGTPWGRMP